MEDMSGDDTDWVCLNLENVRIAVMVKICLFVLYIEKTQGGPRSDIFVRLTVTSRIVTCS